MKTVSDHFAAPFSSAGGLPEGSFDAFLLSKIGDDLRSLYGDVTESELPRALLDMAETIDARRMGEGQDE